MPVTNSAFVFIKPHAVTDKVKEVVKEVFEKRGIEIKKEGQLDAEEIDKKMLIDQHYYAIASKATILKPDKLNVPKEKFQAKFGLEWAAALESGNVLNAKDACEKFEVDADELDKMWAAAKKSDNLVKFGGGFYCAKLEPAKVEGTFYVFNGFFMAMRSKFVAPGTSIYYYVVEWDAATLKWEDFRGEVLGPTDPTEAPADSLRGQVLAKWKDLGLKSEPNVGDNGLHASASPFEGLAERMNWLGTRVDRDPFGKILLKAGVPQKVIKDWAVDPQVTFGPIPITKSLFDSLEDTDADKCAALCQMMAASKSTAKDASKLEAEVEKLRKELESYKDLERAIVSIQKFVPPPPTKITKPKEEGKKKEEPAGKGKGKGKGKAAEEEKPKKRRKSRGGGGGKGKGSGKGKGY